jgi:hypothetical protein
MNKKALEKRQQILNFLQDKSEVIPEYACELYKAAIFAFDSECLPARDVYLASCCYQLLETFWKGIPNKESTDKNRKTNEMEKNKLYARAEKFNPTISYAYLKGFLQDKSSRLIFTDWRHYNPERPRPSSQSLNDVVCEVEEFILKLMKPFGEMAEMSLDEIVKYLKASLTYESMDLENIPNSKYGVGKALEYYVKQNPRKYLDDLLKFKDVVEPIYITHLFSGLRRLEKTESDWKNIAELGLWVSAEQENKDWIDSACIELLRLFKDLFESKGLQVDDGVAKNICDVIEKVLSVSKGHLLLKELESNYNGLDYANTALNSSYGVAVSSLIEYAIWQRENKKDVTCISQTLNEFLNESKYEEIWTLFGMRLPALYSTFKNRTKQNINKILPENDSANDSAKFKAAWITYIIANLSYPKMFDLLKSKFEYALKNKLYIDDEDYMEGLGRHISLYYAVYKQINLDDDMMKLIFDIPELLND